MTRAGDIYAASGEKGGIFTSTDGYRFSQEATPSSAANEILEGIGGTSDLLISVGTTGTILYSLGGYTNAVSTNGSGGLLTNQVSTLGLVWNAVSPKATLNELQGVGVFGSKFIVTGGNGTILTSNDGSNWTARVSGVGRMLSSVTMSPAQALVVGGYWNRINQRRRS